MSSKFAVTISAIPSIYFSLFPCVEYFYRQVYSLVLTISTFLLARKTYVLLFSARIIAFTTMYAKRISGRHNLDFETGLTMGSLCYKYSHLPYAWYAISYYKLLPGPFCNIKTISNYNLNHIREYHCGTDFLGFLDFLRAILLHFRT